MHITITDDSMQLYIIIYLAFCIHLLRNHFFITQNCSMILGIFQLPSLEFCGSKIKKMLWFSESLERDLSNDTIKVDIREIKYLRILRIYSGPRPLTGT